MSLVSQKGVSQLVQNVAASSSKMSDLRDYKNWSESLQFLFEQAGVSAAIQFATVEEFCRAVIVYHDDSYTADGGQTLADMRQEFLGNENRMPKLSDEKPQVHIKQEDKQEEDAAEALDPKRERASPTVAPYTLSASQRRALCCLDASPKTTKRQLNRYFETANSTVVCALRTAVSKDLHHLLENVNDRYSAYEIWHALKEATSSDAISQLNTEARRLFELHMESGDDPSKFMSTFRAQLKQVQENGGQIAFRLAAALYLGGIPQEEYAFELSKLRDQLGRDNSTVDWTTIRKTLMSRYVDQQSRVEADSGYAMVAGSVADKRASTNKPLSDNKCSFCMLHGHTEAECHNKIRVQKAFLAERKAKQERMKTANNRRGRLSQDTRAPDKDLAATTNSDNKSKGKAPSDFCMVAQDVRRSQHVNALLAAPVLVDSCAHHHGCPFKSMFESIHPIKPVSFLLADGDIKRTITATTGGYIKLKNEEGRVLRFFTAYAPSMYSTILSVGQLVQGGCTFSCSADKVMRIHCPEGDLVLSAVLDGGTVFKMYIDKDEMWQQQLSSQLCGLASDVSEGDAENLTKWHKLYGCQHDRAVRTHLKQYGIKTKGSRAFCDLCAANKTTKRVSTDNKTASPVRQKRTVRFAIDDDSQALPKRTGKVHTDLCGPFRTQSNRGDRYLQGIMDQDTGYVESLMLRTKAPHTKLLAFIRRRILQRRPVRTLRSDNGGEFMGKFHDILCDHGIEHELIVPGVPAQNGFAERLNRTILERARTLHQRCGMPDNYWHYSILAATHLHNHTLRKGENSTPYQQFFSPRKGWHPKHFLPLGCLVWVKATVKPGDKMAPTAKPTILVGFDTHKSGTYHLLDLRTSRRLKSNHVSADIQRFPLKEHTHAVRHTTDLFQLLPAIPVSPLSPAIQAHASTLPSDHHRPDPPSVEEEEHKHNDFSNQEEPSNQEELDEEIAQEELDLEELGDQEESLAEDFDQSDQEEVPLVNDVFLKNLTPEEVHRAKVQDTNNKMTEEALATLQERSRSRHNNIADIDAANILHNDVKRSRNAPKDLNKFASSDFAFVNVNATDLDIKVVDSTIDPSTPSTYAEAIASPDHAHWASATEKEMQAIRDFKTWHECDINEVQKAGGHVLSTKWVFKVKRKADGTIDRYKARIVVRGFEQIFLQDYDIVYSPVASLDHVRGIFALASAFNLRLRTEDVPNAFLNGQCDKELFIRPPPGVKMAKGKCLRLVKSLYGLKQAPRLWNKKIHEALLQMGFCHSKLNPCIYYLTDVTGFIILLLYVDDVLTASNSKSLEDFTYGYLNEEFDIRDQGAPYGKKFLGIVSEKTGSGIKLHQGHLITQILQDMRMTDCNSSPTPMMHKVVLEKAKSEGEARHSIYVGVDDDKTEVSYRRIVGMLLYLRNTRPDIAFAVHKLAKHNNAPTVTAWAVLKRLVRYLKGTTHRGLRYEAGTQGAPGITAFSDSDLGGDPDTRRSTSGYVVLLNGKPVSWMAKQQTVTAQSSCEAEYVALCAAGKSIMSWRHLLGEIGFKLRPSVLQGDNNAALSNVANDKHSPSLRHIALPYHYTREQVLEGHIQVKYVSSANNVADIFTKAASAATYDALIPLLMID